MRIPPAIKLKQKPQHITEKAIADIATIAKELPQDQQTKISFRLAIITGTIKALQQK